MYIAIIWIHLYAIWNLDVLLGSIGNERTGIGYRVSGIGYRILDIKGAVGHLV